METERLRVRHDEPRPAAPEQVGVQLRDPCDPVRHRSGRADDHRAEEVVVEVLPDAGQVGAALDPECGELVRGAEPREQQEPGRVDRARAHDHLDGCLDELHVAVALDFDARAPRAREAETAHSRAGEHGQARPSGHRLEKRRPGGGTNAAAHRQLRVADAVELGSVVVRVVGNARFLRGGHHRLDQRVPWISGGHRQRPSRAAVLARPEVAVLGALEEREDVVEAPAVRSVVCPAVVVEPVAADVGEPVERAGTAEHPPAGPREPPPRARALWLGLVAPVDRRARQLGPAAGIVDRRFDGRVPGLHHGHGRARVHESAGDDRAARAGADDNVVERARRGRAHAVRRERASIATANRMIAPRMMSW